MIQPYTPTILTPETYFFDFFDVIHADPQKAFLAEHGLQRDGAFAEASDMLDTGQITTEQYIEIYAKASQKSYEYVDAYFQRSGIDDDVVAIIAELRGVGNTIGLISNGASDEVRNKLEKHNLSPLFHGIVISAEVGTKKPGEQIYDYALRTVNGRPESTFFVDDNPENIATADRLGWHGHLHVGSIALRQKLHDIGAIKAPQLSAAMS